MAGNSSCQDSRLHSQSFIDKRVINELKFLSEKIKYIDVPTLANNILEQKEKMLASAKIVTEQFTKSSDEFDPEAALSDLKNVQGLLSNIWAETSRLKLPSEYRNDSPQESIKKNIRKLFLYNEK